MSVACETAEETAPYETSPGSAPAGRSAGGSAPVVPFPRDCRPVLAGAARSATLAGPLPTPAVRASAPVLVPPRPLRLATPRRPSLRLTVRGRRLISVLVAAAVLGTLLLGARSALHALAGSPIPKSAPAAVIVGPGDTLWSIARRVAPEGDARAVVATLRSRNHLPSATVHPGQRLRVRTG